VKVLYLQPIHPEGMEKLAQRYEVAVAPDTSRETLLREIEDADAVVTRLTPLDRALLERGGRLKAVAKHGVGVDNIDVDYARERGIAVLTTGDANSSTVAEHAMFAIGALLKRIPLLDRAMREGQWAARDWPGSADACGRRLGVIGFGRIGARLARMASLGFDMKVSVHDPYADPKAVQALGYAWRERLEQLLEEADVVSVHVPLTPETRSLLDARRLALLPKGAYVVNFARGGIVQEEALYEALRTGRLAGAALDVFAVEPPDPGHPLFALPNVILSPHCGTFTEDSRRRMSLRLAEEIDAALSARREG